MKFEQILIITFLFVFMVFIIGDVETAVGGVAGDEALKPLFTAIPVVFVGACLYAFVQWGKRGNG